MKKEEVISALKSGKVVRHRYFTEDEYMFQWADGMYCFEDGVKVPPEKFWGLRADANWQTGWELFVDVPHVPFMEGIRITHMTKDTDEYEEAIFIALEGQMVIGQALVYRYTSEIDKKDERDTPALANIYVHPDYRKRGIGLALQEAREAYAKRRWKQKTICLWVKKGSWMEAWYRRRGFGNENPKDENTIWLYKTVKEA